MRGLGYGILGALASTLMSRIIHQKSATFTVYELVWIRNSAITLGLLPFVARDLRVLLYPEGRLLWIRGALGSVGVLLFFYLLQLTHVSEAFFLSNLTPLLTVFLGVAILNEKPTARQRFGTAIMLGAITLRSLPHSFSSSNLVLLVAAAMAIVQSFAFISIKKSAGRFPATLIVFMFSGASLFVVPFFSLRWTDIGHAYTQYIFWWFILLGFAVQIFVTKSFEYLSAGQAVLIGQVGILFAAFVEIMLGERTLTPLDVISTVVLFIGLYLISGARSLSLIDINIGKERITRLTGVLRQIRNPRHLQ